MQEIYHQVDFDEKPQEECGITLGLSKTDNPITPLISLMEDKLQHRGSDTAGIVAFHSPTGQFELHKGPGKVLEVFPQPFNPMGGRLLSDRAAGQNRYATSEKSGDKDDISGSQPIIVEYEDKKLAIVYNGNLTDEDRAKLRKGIPDDLREEDTFDTVDIGHAIISAPGNDLAEQIRNGLKGINFGYSIGVIGDDGRMFGLRSPGGTWPLMVGETDSEFIMASETRVDQVVGKKVAWSEVRRGELVEMTKDGLIRNQIFEPVAERVCSLHAMYGARGDSMMTENGVTYSEFRQELGRELAHESPVWEADLIVGVPQTGLDIAIGYAEALNKQPSNILKLRQTDRTYIAKNLDESTAILSGKFLLENPEQVKGKKAVIVEDSMIKGLTMGGNPEKNAKGIVQMFREAGASEVHIRTIMGKFIKGCDTGYVIRKDQLIAMMRQEDGSYLELTEEQIAEKVGADSFKVLSIEGAKKIYGKKAGNEDMACFACVGGQHPAEELKEKVIYSVR